MNAQQVLLNWCQANLDGYDSIKVKDFSSSWRNGLAFHAILNRHRPQKIEYDELKLKNNSNYDNLDKAFNFAHSEFGLVKILDPEDVDTDNPDEKSIMTYVSMLFNVIPSVPLHPSQIKLDIVRRSLLDEYSLVYRSLMRWLRDSILTVDNRTVPNNIAEIKAILNDVKTFRLEEYASKLKEKKNLIGMYHELMGFQDTDKETLESEFKVIEKIWQKFDNFIQMRENVLEKTYKKYENLHMLIQKIDKLYDACNKRLDQIEMDYSQFLQQSKTPNSIQLRSFSERFEEQIRLCDQDLRKMLIDVEHLKDEQHNEADYYYNKINQLQNKSFEIRSNIIADLNANNFRLSISENDETNKFQVKMPIRSTFETSNYLDFIEQKKNQIVKQPYSFELKDILNEISDNTVNIKNIESFRQNYIKDYGKFKESKANSKHIEEDSNHKFNELEIAYNLLYNSASYRLKCLRKLELFVKSVNEEMSVLDQKEDVELARDWSSPDKLKSGELKLFKNNLDADLSNRYLVFIEPLMLRGEALISDKHPASETIKAYMDKLRDHFDWIKQLSNILHGHTKNLIDYENFNAELQQKAIELESFKNTLSNTIQNSKTQTYAEDIQKLEALKHDLEKFNLQLKETVEAKSSKIVSFKLRKHALKHPNNKCICLTSYQNSQISIKEGEECIIEDNTQRIKWKVTNPSTSQTGIVPGVCFALTTLDDEVIEASQMLKNKSLHLLSQLNSFQVQFRKERLFSLMNIILFCELEEFERRRKKPDVDKLENESEDLNVILTNIKVDIDALMHDASKTQSDTHTMSLKNDSGIDVINTSNEGDDAEHLKKLNNNNYFNDDMKILIENYEKCCKKLNELSEKSHIKDERNKFEKEINTELECIEMKLKYLADKCSQLGELEKNSTKQQMSSVSYVEKLISQYNKEISFK